MSEPVFNPPHMLLKFDPHGDPKRPWVTACEHTFAWPMENLYSSVPEGYRTDLTSYPRWLAKVLLALWVLAPFFSWMPWVIGIVATLGLLLMCPYGLGQRAALHHDRGYSAGGSRRVKDTIYIVMMKIDGVAPWRRALRYVAVRVFGGLHFGKSK